MKNLISLFTILFCLNAIGQDNSLPEIPEWMGNSCENGIKFAKRDAEKGIYKLINFGLILRIGDEWEFAEYYENYLLENYNIENYYAGCSVYSKGECYSKEMRKIILKKYGNDFFERTRNEVQNLFDKNMILKIDTGYVFNYSDEEPSFEGGKDSLYNFLSSHLKFPKSCMNGKIKGKVYCQFIIEKDGSISNIKILKTPDDCFSNEVIRVVKMFPNWSPAIYKNKPIKYRTIIPVMFN